MTNITIPRAVLEEAEKALEMFDNQYMTDSDRNAYGHDEQLLNDALSLVRAALAESEKPNLLDYSLKNDDYKTTMQVRAESEKQERDKTLDKLVAQAQELDMGYGKPKQSSPLVLTEVIEDGGNYIDENGKKHELNNIHVYKPAYEKSDNYIHKEPSVRNLIYKDEELARELAQTILQCGYRRQPNEPWDLEEKICASWIIKAFAKVREDERGRK